MKADVKVQTARVQLLYRQPFYAILLLGLEEVWDDEATVSCAINTRRILYNTAFMDTLTVEQTIGLMAHEACHLGLLHPLRTKGRDFEVWNEACDYAVNLLVVKDAQLEVPPGGRLDDRFVDMAAERIYDILIKEKKPQQGGKCGPTARGTGAAPPGVKGRLGTGSPGKGRPGAGRPGTGRSGVAPSPSTTPGASGEPGKGFDEHPWQGLTDQEIKDAERQLTDEIVKAATIAKSAGKLPGRWAQLVQEMLRPQIDWRERMRNFVVWSAKSDYSLSVPNRRHLWRGVYLPSLKSERLEIALAVDTSGSIGSTELIAFNAEVRGIAESFESYCIYYFQCDSRIHDERVFQNGDPLPIKMKGRGGTSYVPVFEKVKALPDVSCLVYLTDGYPNDGWPPPLSVPVLWVLTTDVVPPYGEYIRIQVRERH